ncbi:hypothetical protein Trydic_g17253 [Trypoxylus dichotomus]
MSSIQNEILSNYDLSHSECKNNYNESLIKPINRDTVHKICSGQVVLNLSIAVKELVENAIDAGATNIEIKLKEYGSEFVEVIDNGPGVLEDNFASLTLKHHTSKLKEFIDLESVETLGFRGEALSSLCALSNVIITTRHRTANVATKIEYDHNGKIIKQSPISRPEGTTVTISNIFSTLPVRRKEFMKNLKKEFNKMCQLLYAYCLVSVNIKITCSNQTKASKTIIMATQASSVRENIINVFGAKQISNLIDITVAEPNETVLEEFGIKPFAKETIPFSFEFLISSVTHGSGRIRLENDLFIIDQHASDEKYNFEELQRNTILETQILVNPKELYLTAANESLLIDNEDIFKKNGFVFSIDRTAPPTRKVKLTAIPVSKNYSFGKDDIDELLFMLQDGNDMMCRPSRIRQMFASRACRKSVMVGKALNENDMRKLVNHMGDIDQPWNCPHGRPTMRHLITMNLIQER